jgi:cytochrome c-type biogenesis protein CcmF
VTGELGQLALCFALALSLVMAAAGLLGTRADAAAARRVATSSALGLLVFVVLAFGTLTYAFIVSDFSIAAVANHSHTLKPLVYKISGVWGNHEGSMLLWVLVLALYAALVAWHQRRAGHAGPAGGGVPAFYSFHLQSVPAPGSRAV